MMQHLSKQIINCAGTNPASPEKVESVDRASSPVGPQKRTAKVLCKPNSKNVGVMPMMSESKQAAVQVNDSLAVKVENRGTTTNDQDIEQPAAPPNIESTTTKNAETGTITSKTAVEPSAEGKPKLVIQILPSINIPRELVVQKIPDVIITSKDSLLQSKNILNNNIGYIIMKHSSNDKIDKIESINAKPCGCLEIKEIPSKAKVETSSGRRASKFNKRSDGGTAHTNPRNANLVTSILKGHTQPCNFEKPRPSIASSIVSFDYESKKFTNNGITKPVEFFNNSYKSDSNSEIVCIPTEDDVFDRASKLSTFVELGKLKTDTKVKDYVKDIMKDPKTELMFKSFQLINESVINDYQPDLENEEVDVSTIDIEFYKTFVNPEGPKVLESMDSLRPPAKASPRSRQRPSILPSSHSFTLEGDKKEDHPPSDRSSYPRFSFLTSDDNSSSTKPQRNAIRQAENIYRPEKEITRFRTSNDMTKPSDSDFSEVLFGLSKNAKNSYADPEEGPREMGRVNSPPLFENFVGDPIEKVRELYHQDMHNNTKLPGNFTTSHSVDMAIPLDIQEKLQSTKLSGRRTEIEFKGIEPFTKSQSQKAVPKMIDINVNNFLNTKPDSVNPDNDSIYSDTTEDVILEIDTDALREAQHHNLSNVSSGGRPSQVDSVFNEEDGSEFEYVITHDISIQTSLEYVADDLIDQQLHPSNDKGNDKDKGSDGFRYKDTNKVDDRKKNDIKSEEKDYNKNDASELPNQEFSTLHDVFFLPKVSFTSITAPYGSNFNVLGMPNTNTDQDDVYKNLVTEESLPKPSPEEAVGESNENQIATFISQLTSCSIVTDPKPSKILTTSTADKQSARPIILSKYNAPTLEIPKRSEISTQTSYSNTSLDKDEKTSSEGNNAKTKGSNDEKNIENQTQTDEKFNVWRTEVKQLFFLKDVRMGDSYEIGEYKFSDAGGDEVKGIIPETFINSNVSDSTSRSERRKMVPNTAINTSSSSSSPAHSLYKLDRMSNLELPTISDKSDGEISVTYSASIGEIFNKHGDSARHFKKYPQELIDREFGKNNMKIRRRKVNNSNWVTYYMSKNSGSNSNSETLDDSSHSSGLVKRK